MHRLVLTLTLGVALTVAVCGSAQAAGRHTVRVVVRPVTSAGRPASGYVVKIQSSPAVDCSTGESSAAAVDRDIAFCRPDYVDAVACWRSSTAHHVLCLRNARTTTLVKLRAAGPIASTTPLHKRAPLDLTLDNGVKCALRVGGASTSLKQHPSWAAWYFCSHHLAIWAPLNATNWGLNRAHPVWTAHVAAASGSQRVAKHAIARTWFVGTAD